MLKPRQSTLALLPTLAVLAAGCTPGSLVEAIQKEEGNGIFGKPQYIVVPLSTNTVLGYIPGQPITEEIDKSRLLTAAPTRCFFVVGQEYDSLGKLEVKYDNSQKLSAELDATVAKVGASVGHESSATLSLSGLKVVKGIGVLDTTGPCALDATKTMKVFTQALKASSVSLDFASQLKVDANAAVPVNAAMKISAGTGVGSSKGTTLSGQNIVLGGLLTDVKIDVARNERSLGTDPVANTYDFPTGFDGTVTVVAFKASEQALTIRAQTQSGVPGTLPAGIPSCKLGEDSVLKLGDKCNFWFPAGNAQVSVEWRYGDAQGGARPVLLIVRGYKTTFNNP